MILICLKLQIPSIASKSTTKTNGFLMLLRAFSHSFIVESQFFSISNFSYCSHDYFISTVDYFKTCSTVWKTRVRKSWCISSFNNRIYHNKLCSSWVIYVSFFCNVIKVRKIFWKLLFVLSLLYDVLFLIPSPSRVNLPKILSNQLIWLYSFLFIANDPDAFWVNSKSISKIWSWWFSTIQKNFCKFFINFVKHRGVKNKV